MDHVMVKGTEIVIDCIAMAAKASDKAADSQLINDSYKPNDP